MDFLEKPVFASVCGRSCKLEKLGESVFLFRSKKRGNYNLVTKCSPLMGCRTDSSPEIVQIHRIYRYWPVFFGKTNIDEWLENEYPIDKLDYLFEVGAM